MFIISLERGQIFLGSFVFFNYPGCIIFYSHWNISSVFVKIGLALGASPGSHSETPNNGWAFDHCCCIKTTSLCDSIKESTTWLTFSAEHRDSGCGVYWLEMLSSSYFHFFFILLTLTSVPPSFVWVTVGGSYNFVGLFQSLACGAFC